MNEGTKRIIRGVYERFIREGKIIEAEAVRYAFPEAFTLH